jgi:hypothetical protein
LQRPAGAYREHTFAVWRLNESLYPGLTERKLMTNYMAHHAAELARRDKFYADLA